MRGVALGTTYRKGTAEGITPGGRRSLMLFINLPSPESSTWEGGFRIGNWANVAWLKIDAGGPRVGLQGMWA